MYDKNSDYALNKLAKDAIVCKSATGEDVLLTRADFASDEEFRQWKDWSDNDYQDRENAGRGYYDRCLPLDTCERRLTVPSPEDALIAGITATERQKAAAVRLAQVRETLTKTQYRRLCMQRVQGMTEAEIAVAEGVKQQSVSENIASAKKKLKNL